MTNYLVDVIRGMGETSARRILEKGQRSEQTQVLMSLVGELSLRNYWRRAAWSHGDAFRRAVPLFRRLADLTGAAPFYALWKALLQSEYWSSARSRGVTLEKLRELMRAPIVTLMFHSISAPADVPSAAFRLEPKRFVRFLEWLRFAEYRTTFPREWLAGSLPDRQTLLTFDDGYDDLYTQVYPTIEGLGMKATVFLVVDQIGKTNAWDLSYGHAPRKLLTLDHIREMNRHGIRFGSHSLSHARLTRLGDAELEKEVGDSKRKLEDLIGEEVEGIAYPWGDVDFRVRQAVCRAGYRFGMTAKEGRTLYDDPLTMRRTNISGRDSLMGFVFKIRTGRSLRTTVKRWFRRSGASATRIEKGNMENLGVLG